MFRDKTFVEGLIAEKIEHYKMCYRKNDELTYETLVAILQSLLVDVQSVEPPECKSCGGEIGADRKCLMCGAKI